MAHDRMRMTLVTRGGDVVVGQLLAVGADVVSVRLDGGAAEPCYVAAGAILEAVLDC